MTATSSSAAGPLMNEYQLKVGNELRLEVGREEVALELLSGTAEVFGTPLSLHKRYTLPPGFRCAIFTYKGAQVEVVGRTESAYIAQQTPMVIYLNTHAALEVMRKVVEGKLAALATTGLSSGEPSPRGPRLMVAGPTDVGKSTLCRILCNYAVREGRNLQLVDLDVGQGSVSVPGAIGSLYIEKPADLIDSFDRRPAYVFHFGHVTPSVNMAYYDQLVKQLAVAVKRKQRSLPAAKIGGYIVNTCGWVKGEGYEMIVKAAEAFEPDVVVVLDHERLFNELQKDLPNFVRICHMPKSGGVEGRSQALRSANRHNAIHRNFYGTRQFPFYPHSFELSYDKPVEEVELLIAKVGTEALPEALLPAGTIMEDHRLKVVQVPIDMRLTDRVLALMPPGSTINSTLTTKPAIGFLVVTNVDLVSKTMTILSPQPHPLPSRLALLSDVTFVDDDVARTYHL